MRAVLGGVVFDEEVSSGFTIGSFDGWDDGPTPRSGADLIPEADGAFEVARTYLAPRVMTLSGLLLDGPDAQVDASRFRAIHSAGQPQLLQVVDRDGVWTLSVGVEEAILRPIVGGLCSYSLTLIARDPVKYTDELALGPVGLPTHTGGLILPKVFPWEFGVTDRGDVTLVNDGSVPVLPRVVVSGSADGIVVHGGPRRLEFGAFSGELVLDSRDRRAWLNGVDVTRLLLRRDWYEVPAGASQEFFFVAEDPSADTVMTVQYRIGAW